MPWATAAPGCPGRRGATALSGQGLLPEAGLSQHLWVLSHGKGPGGWHPTSALPSAHMPCPHPHTASPAASEEEVLDTGGLSVPRSAGVRTGHSCLPGWPAGEGPRPREAPREVPQVVGVMQALGRREGQGPVGRSAPGSRQQERSWGSWPRPARPRCGRCRWQPLADRTACAMWPREQRKGRARGHRVSQADRALGARAAGRAMQMHKLSGCRTGAGELGVHVAGPQPPHTWPGDRACRAWTSALGG